MKLPIGFFDSDLVLKNSFVNAVKPNDAKTITEIDAKTSNLTNVEAVYTPMIPKIKANDNISFLIKLDFLFWEFLIINQTPKPEKIISTEWNRNDWDKVVVACSDTESTNGSVVVKNGFSALRYLWLAEGKNWDSEFATKIKGIRIKNASKNIKPFLVLFLADLLCIKMQDTKNKVEVINEIPPMPKIKPELTRSNPNEIMIVLIV